MKVACVGNMNNGFFSVVRHLRNRGYAADLFLVNEFEHFKPASDTFDLQSVNGFIRELNIPNEDILKIDKRKVFSVFEEYDFIIACGFSIAYLTYSGVKINLVIPYGSDFYEVPFFKKDHSRSDYVNLQKRQTAKYQRKGIEEADDLIWDVTNEKFEKIVEQFALKGKRHKYTLPFIYTPEFSWKNDEFLRTHCEYRVEMEQLRKRYSFIAFNHIRQSWKNPMDEWSQKGNDKIFKAFAQFIKTVNPESCLIVFEYGSDVEVSKILVHELGISDNVIWFPITQRRNLAGMISYADVGIGEISDNGWFSYFAIFEFMAMKKPVIHYRNDALHQNRESGLYPMYDAANEEQIFNALQDCFKNPEEAENKAIQAHEWFIKTGIEKPLEIITSAIKKAKEQSVIGRKRLKKFFLVVQEMLSYQKISNKINLRLEPYLDKTNTSQS